MSITIQSLLDAGAHFGHRTHRWNPKMRPYIYGARNGIYVINLEKTLSQWQKAIPAVIATVRRGKKILFVGTKAQAQDIVQEEATRAGQYYVNGRWLGGMLTNFKTIRQRLDRLQELEEKLNSTQIDHLTKKERVGMAKEFQKLDKALHGIREMKETPGMVVLIDPNREHIALREAQKLHIPVLALTDTNCDPDGIDYMIPSNDDAFKSIRLFLHEIAEACVQGEKEFEKRIQEETARAMEARAKQEAAKAAQAENGQDMEVTNTGSVKNGPEVVVVSNQE